MTTPRSAFSSPPGGWRETIRTLRAQLAAGVAHEINNPVGYVFSNFGTLEKYLGELFRMLSYAKIGTSTLQSRADAAVAGGTYIFCLPGSPGACRDGWDDILVHQLDIRHQPCNFAELLPRLREHEPRG